MTKFAYKMASTRNGFNSTAFADPVTARKRKRPAELEKQGSNTSETSQVLLPKSTLAKPATRASKLRQASKAQANLVTRESRGARSLLAGRKLKAPTVKISDAENPAAPAKKQKKATSPGTKASKGRRAANSTAPLLEPARQGKLLQVLPALLRTSFFVFTAMGLKALLGNLT